MIADPGLDSGGLKSHLSRTPAAEALTRLIDDDWLNRQHFLRPDAELEDVRAGLRETLLLHRMATAASREVNESAAQLFTDGEAIWKAAAAAREELAQSVDNGPGEGTDADRPTGSGEDDGQEVSSADFIARLGAALAAARDRAK